MHNLNIKTVMNSVVYATLIYTLVFPNSLFGPMSRNSAAWANPLDLATPSPPPGMNPTDEGTAFGKGQIGGQSVVEDLGQENDAAAALEKVIRDSRLDVNGVADELAKLDEIFRGKRVGVHPLDPFGALSTRTVDKRFLPIPQQDLDIILGPYRERDSELAEAELKRYFSMISDDTNEKTLISEHYDIFKAMPTSKLSQIVEGFSFRLGLQMNEAIDFFEALYNPKSHRNSPFSKVKKSYYAIRNDVVSNNQVVRGRAFLGSAEEGFFTDNLMLPQPMEWQDDGSPTFSFFSAGRVFEERTIPIEAVFFYGHYLIFIEPHGYLSEEGIQYISFIDLEKYGASMGIHGAPTFKFPLKVEQKISDARIENGVLLFDQHPVTEADILPYSDLWELFFNISVNALDPKLTAVTARKAAALEEYVLQAKEYFFDGLGDQSENLVSSKEMFARLGHDLNQAVAIRNGIDLPVPLTYQLAQMERADIPADILQEEAFEKALAASATQHTKFKKVFNRVKLYLAGFSLPRPDGLPTYRQALASLSAHYSQKSNSDLRADHLREGLTQILNHPYSRFGFATVVAAVIGTTYPEVAADFLLDSVLTAGGIIAAVFGKVGDFGSLMWDVTTKTLTGLNPFYAVPYLVENGGYLAVGFLGTFAQFVLAPAFISVWTINLFKMVKDIHDIDPGEPARGNAFQRFAQKTRTFVKNFSKDAFIEQQRQFRAETLKALGESMKAGQGQNTKPSPEDIAQNPDLLAAVEGIGINELSLQVEQRIRELEEEKLSRLQDHWWYRATIAVKEQSGRLFTMLKKVSPSATLASSEQGQKIQGSGGFEIDGIGKATRHFLMSWPALIISQKTLAKYFWNSWFLFRSFVWHPVVSTTALLHPNFAFTVAKGFEDEAGNFHINLPSRWNGTKRYLWQVLQLKILETDQWDALRAWEDKMLLVEQEIHKEALKSAFRATARFVKDSGELKKLYQNGLVNNFAAGVINRLDKQQQIFFRSYVAGVMEDATEHFLRDYFSQLLKRHQHSQGDETGEIVNLLRQLESDRFDPAVLERLKQETISQLDDLNCDQGLAARLVEESAERINAFENSQKLARDDNLEANTKKFLKNFFVNMPISKLHRDNNRQINRVMTVNRMLEDPQNVARGVRAVASGWKVSYPLGLAITILFLAGIDEGILQLVRPDEMFGDESYLYLSKYVVLGFALTAFLHIVGGADLWMKVQVDEMHEGKFNQRLDKEEADMGLMALWFKRSFKNTDNTLLQAHMHFLQKFIIPNIKAATVTYALTYGITMGRFDLGAFVTGYILAVLLPTYAMDFKMDQGFELATGSKLATQFTPEMLAHPRVQEYIMKEIARYRDFYNLGNKFYEAALARFVENLQLFGAGRDFERFIFAGHNMAELTVVGSQHLNGIPGLESIGSFCERILTNGMDPAMFEKVPPPAWISR